MTRAAHQLLFGCDHAVATWTWTRWQLVPTPIHMAIGIVDRHNQMVGSVALQWFNGSNIELSYYGIRTLTHTIVRQLARVAIEHYNVNRVTIRTGRQNVAIVCGLRKFGFRIEGFERRFYGPTSDAVRMVLFREDLERLAGVKHELVGTN